MSELRSCPGCQHYEGAFEDRDTGYNQRDYCGAAGNLHEKGECTEAVSLMFESILFQLSALNNCPLRAEKSRSLRRGKE
jgi:hypothetical protein